MVEESPAPQKKTKLSSDLEAESLSPTRSSTEDSPCASLKEQLRMVCKTPSWHLTIAEIQTACLGLNKLAMLTFGKVVEKAAFGTPLESIEETLTRCEIDNHMDVSSATTFSEYWIGLKEYRITKVSEELSAAIAVLAEAVRNPCARRANMVKADELVNRCACFTARPVAEISVADFCPVIEFLSEHGSFDATQCKDTAEFWKCQDWIESWLKRHPEVQEYLDPPLVFVESLAGAPMPANLFGVLGLFPLGGGGLAAAPIPQPLPGVAAGSMHLFSVANTADAKTVAIGLRTHFGLPAGGGGAGAALSIGWMSTSGAGITFV